MKKTFIPFIVLIVAMFTTVAHAQTPVELHITHKLGGGALAFKQTAKNNLGNDFNISRLQYFISRISIWHDGGMVTPVPNHYILADGAVNVTDALGSFNITTVDSISFYIGVDTPVNHADPTQHPQGHPLALTSPPMHWGWAAGYRFVAIEGDCGPTMTNFYTIHALEDNLYFGQTVQVSSVTRDGKLIIPLYADYTKALKDIDVSTGLAAHGNGFTEAALIDNFRYEVFSAGAPVSVTTVAPQKQQVNIYPNPATAGQVTLYLNNVDKAQGVTITDISGRIIHKQNLADGTHTLDLNIQQAGLYFVRVAFADGSQAVSKLVVN